MSKQSAAKQQVGAFVLNNDATYSWTVYVFIPKANGGGKTKTKFKVEFRHVSRERKTEILEEFRAQLKRRELLTESPQSDDDIDAVKEIASFQQLLLEEAVVSFSGVVDQAGQEVPCTEATKKQLLSNAWASDAIMAAYTTSLQGRSDQGN